MATSPAQKKRELAVNTCLGSSKEKVAPKKKQRPEKAGLKQKQAEEKAGLKQKQAEEKAGLKQKQAEEKAGLKQKQAEEKAGLKQKQAEEKAGLKQKQAEVNDVVQSKPNMVTSPAQKKRRLAAVPQQGSSAGGSVPHQSPSSTSFARLHEALQELLELQRGVSTAEEELRVATRELAYPDVTTRKFVEANQKLSKAHQVQHKQWDQVFGLLQLLGLASPRLPRV